jgi:cell division protein FtsI (penicillin-binding protein 3)
LSERGPLGPARARDRPANRRPAAAPRRRRTRADSHRLRLLAVVGLVVGALIALSARLVFIQTVDAAGYGAFGTSEVYQRTIIPAVRGTVYDRNGTVIAMSQQGHDVVADDFLIHDPLSEAEALAPVLGIGSPTLQGELSERNGYVVLVRMEATAIVNRVAALALPGITFQADSSLAVPSGDLLSPLLGIVGFEGHGLAGLEYQYDNVLYGTPGSEEVPESPTGVQLPGLPTDVVPATQGESLVLTIDEPLQWVVTSDLAAQIRATHANSGTCIITDPRTGAILAMVDLVVNAHGAVVPAEQNLALTAVYQPGSVMKLVTISGAIEEGLITPHTVFTVPYSLYLGGWQFEDADYHPTEKMPVSEILAQSSNIGTIKIAALLGPQRLSYFLRDFGYGQYTGLDWPGESPGIVGTPATWSASSMGTVPIGTGVAVTAMQVLDAYNAVANGGVFVPPRLVEATIGAAGAETDVPAAPEHRILTAATAAQVVPLLEGVVNDGTGTAAQIAGYTVAGKTGTAQIPSTTEPGYQPGAWNATFVGFLPAENPSLSGIVVINHPRTTIYGGAVSAPVFSEIMRYALRHFDVPPVDSSATAAP